MLFKQPQSNLPNKGKTAQKFPNTQGTMTATMFKIGLFPQDLYLIGDVMASRRSTEITTRCPMSAHPVMYIMYA